jgi:hypothetical protein
MKSRINLYKKQYNHWVIRGIYDLEDVVVVVVVVVAAARALKTLFINLPWALV